MKITVKRTGMKQPNSLLKKRESKEVIYKNIK